MLGVGTWKRKTAVLLALCAGGVAASAPAPAPAPWTPDADEQFLLDVNIRQLRLGDPVRAYNTPEGTCVVLGDFLTALDVPMRIDIAAKRASGWAFKESYKISIDYAAGTSRYGAKSEAIEPGTIRETPEGWCVQTAALARWFGIGVKPVTSGSALMLQSATKLPVELAMERHQRAAHLKKASFDLQGLPQVRIPYRMWRAPALDFVVSGGVTYRARDGARVDRQSSIRAAGEIARLSYDAQLTTTQKGKPNLLRVRAYRSDPDGQLLGPLKATHIGVGDVEGFDTRLTGTAVAGRGAVLTNRPLTARTAFDRTRLEGDLPSGWEAEVYRNGELLGFAKSGSDQRYVFDDVQLLYGENRVQVVLYGPQGQVRTREEVINVGQDNVPKGKTWYWAGVNQPGRDVVSLEKPPDGALRVKAQGVISVEHGLDDRTSVAALARTMLIGDERVTFIEGAVRRSIGPAMVEVSAARESAGGTAARAQIVGKFGGLNLSAEGVVANDFHLQGLRRQSLKEGRIALDAPIKVGRVAIPAHVEAHYADRTDGTRLLEAAARLSANVDRFNLATDVRYRRQYSREGPSPPGELALGLIGSGRFGDVRLRGSTDFEVTPQSRFRSAELSAYWSASDRSDWEAGVAYDGPSKRARARVSHVLRLDSAALALTAEAATDRSVAFGFNLNFSLDPRRGLNLSRRPLASAGSLRATVFRDLNGNETLDAGEPLEKGALVTTGMRPSERSTGGDGTVTINGLTAYQPLAVGIDVTSLKDPMLVPAKALQVVVPRPGAPADVQIALVGGGDVEGALVRSGGIGFEGVDIELLDSAGKVVGTTRTDFDGFFLFERVAYGSYKLRVAATSAAAAKIMSDLGVRFDVKPDRSIVRLGSIQVKLTPVLASAAQVSASR